MMRLPGLLAIWLTLVISLCLQVMPLPDAWLMWRPNWLGLALAYWCVTAPQRVGVFHGFVCGLLLDLIEGTPLGQNALKAAAQHGASGIRPVLEPLVGRRRDARSPVQLLLTSRRLLKP